MKKKKTTTTNLDDTNLVQNRLTGWENKWKGHKQVNEEKKNRKKKNNEHKNKIVRDNKVQA